MGVDPENRKAPDIGKGPKNHINIRILLLGIRAPIRGIPKNPACRILMFMWFCWAPNRGQWDRGLGEQVAGGAHGVRTSIIRV